MLPHINFLQFFARTYVIYLYVFSLFSASAQAYFCLEKPVSHIVPHIERLEYDINAEIGVPGAKVQLQLIIFLSLGYL